MPLILLALLLFGCEPATYPSGTSCGDVYVGYYCCGDGYPGQCPDELYCYPPDECRGPTPPNDDGAQRSTKRRGL
jgi:hypothetical protein